MIVFLLAYDMNTEQFDNVIIVWIMNCGDKGKNVEVESNVLMTKKK